LQLGEDEEIDCVVEYVSRQLTRRPLLPELDAAVLAQSELASSLLYDAQNADRVRLCITTYFLADAFFASILKDQPRQLASLSEAQSIDPTISLLDIATLVRNYKQAKKRLKEADAALSERSAIKLEIGLSDISALIAVTSTVFVVSGFLYTRYFFSLFGVDVSLFFSLGDYLAASIEQIRYGASATAFGLCPVGHFKFPHPWPGQIPPGRTCRL
jgi:hypothetical protein